MATPTLWSAPPKSLTLAENEYHVWRSALQCDRAHLGNLEASLNKEEKLRASKFLVADARKRFVLSRSILRELLGRYLKLDAAEITLGSGPYGKPFLDMPAAAPIQFNISHSHEYGAFVFAKRRQVGIDIEKIRPEAAGGDIAKRFFSQGEIEQLAAMTEKDRIAGFFACWTKKEAYIKARGEGLQIPLHSFSVSIADAERQELLDGDGSCWSVYPFEPAPGFAGAVASEGKEGRLRLWEWE
jgi:4'-phosphopantetheinyl transferase